MSSVYAWLPLGYTLMQSISFTKVNLYVINLSWMSRCCRRRQIKRNVSIGTVLGGQAGGSRFLMASIEVMMMMMIMVMIES